jgi:hypothetical protein
MRLDNFFRPAQSRICESNCPRHGKFRCRGSRRVSAVAQLFSLGKSMRHLLLSLLSEREPTLYGSLLFGCLSWILAILRLTSILGDSLASLFWFIPFALVGFLLAGIAHHRCSVKKAAMVAVWLSALPLIWFLILIVLTATSFSGV